MMHLVSLIVLSLRFFFSSIGTPFLCSTKKSLVTKAALCQIVSVTFEKADCMA